MIATERLEKIVEMVDKSGIKNIKEMAKEFNVTEMTIRRDCEELEKQGKLIRVRGGAKSIKKQHVLSMYNMKTVQEREAFSPAKELVCKKAASFVKDGECIFLDGGSSLVLMLNYIIKEQADFFMQKYFYEQIKQISKQNNTNYQKIA